MFVMKSNNGKSTVSLNTSSITDPNELPPDVVLSYRDLSVYFATDDGILKATNHVNLDLKYSQKLGLIGESGCGKTVTAHSVLRITPRNGWIETGKILYRKKDGTEVDLAQVDPRGAEIRNIRGGEIGIVFQEPMTSLSAVHTIGNQIIEGVRLHITKNGKEAYEIALEMLQRVGIANPKQRMIEYPHQLSGGMRQRALIALSLACKPSVLIADEPTTALDVTMQAQILELIQELQQDYNMSIIYITHDLGVIAEVCDYVAVMYLGRVVEFGDIKQIFGNPYHPYTQALLRSIPIIGKNVNELAVIEGNVPRPINLPEQCGFCGRCPDQIVGLCDRSIPVNVEIDSGHFVECFLYGKDLEVIDE
jgi:peptide/nickel transport system ATP-binding protein